MECVDNRRIANLLVLLALLIAEVLFLVGSDAYYDPLTNSDSARVFQGLINMAVSVAYVILGIPFLIAYVFSVLLCKGIRKNCVLTAHKKYVNPKSVKNTVVSRIRRDGQTNVKTTFVRTSSATVLGERFSVTPELFRLPLWRHPEKSSATLPTWGIVPRTEAALPLCTAKLRRWAKKRKPGIVKAYFIYGVFVMLLAVFAAISHVALNNDNPYPGVYVLIACAPPGLERLVFFIWICMGMRSLHQLRSVTGSPHSRGCHARTASGPLGDSPLLAAIVATRKFVDHAKSTRCQRGVQPWATCRQRVDAKSRGGAGSVPGGSNELDIVEFVETAVDNELAVSCVTSISDPGSGLLIMGHRLGPQRAINKKWSR
ncbi:hypothetical protein MSG28_004567 [Choristoneura fumiferana]|uniref:Uncharacterized protein n=1 Tax=Choristoneura fumiferana TaxID=7141 RepID=A0ACC0K6I9_CHOFU|nr:hypothetical protein MSG28_004567 [Choristoneura fumiferana]